MAALLRSELLRLRSRQTVVAILLGLVVLGLGLMAGQIATHHDDYAQAAGEFRATRSAAYDDELAGYRANLEVLGAGQLPPEARELTKEEYVAGREFMGGTTPVPTQRFDTAVLMVEMTKVVTVLAVVAAYFAGATLAGADWRHRTMQGLLMWEPRRGRVFLAKATAAVLGVLAVYLPLQAGVQGLGMLGGAWRGTTQGVDAAWWTDQLQAVGRGALVVGIAAVAGFSVALLCRSAAIALGAAIGIVGLERLIAAARPEWGPWTVSEAVSAFLDGGGRLTLLGAGDQVQVVAVSAGAALTTLTVWLVACTTLALLGFRLRDPA